MEGPFYASPVCHDGVLYCVSNQGVLYALDAKTGKIHYRKELEIPSAGGMPGMEAANIYGSLTMGGRHLLLTNDVGDTLVLAPGNVYREHAHNYLDEGSGATAVAERPLLLLRGIGSKQASNNVGPVHRLAMLPSLPTE
jgi:outer membrane protein assembly factor BamB